MTLNGSGSGISLFHVNTCLAGSESGYLCEAGTMGEEYGTAAQKSRWPRVAYNASTVHMILVYT